MPALVQVRPGPDVTPKGSQSMRDEQLINLEKDLQKVQGVRGARVVGVDRPSEIHIVSSSARPPKQVVRDVQSLASAGYGISIDHRIVSVVQLEEDAEPEASSDKPASTGSRPVVDSVVFASKGGEGWIRVRLRWPSDELTEGLAPFRSERQQRAEGAATAALQALHPKLEAAGARVTVDEVSVRPGSVRDVVLVQCTITSQGQDLALSGSCGIEDDVATASVNALLQALNRRLSSLL